MTQYGTMPGGVTSSKASGRACCCGLELDSLLQAPLVALYYCKGEAAPYSLLADDIVLERLEQVTKQIPEKFDATNSEHVAMVTALWPLAFPREEAPVGLEPSSQWKDLGFQSEKPETDMRGAAVYSLRLMVYMARNHGAVF